VGKMASAVAVKKKERIGFDFDNTLTRLPFPFSFLNRVFNCAQTPRFIYEVYFNVMIRLPIFLNHKKLKVIKLFSDQYDMFIITGRWNGEVPITYLLDKYGYFVAFKGIYAPHPPPRVSIQSFKWYNCRRLDLDWYFEDNYYTIYYLWKRGIKVVRV